MPCRQVIRKSWPSGPTPYLLRRLGDAEPNTVARSEVRLRERLRRKEGRKKGRELLTFLRLARAGRICTNSPGIAPSDKIPFPSPLAPTSSKKTALKSARKMLTKPSSLPHLPPRAFKLLQVRSQSLPLPLSFAFYPSPSRSVSDWYRWYRGLSWAEFRECATFV